MKCAIFLLLLFLAAGAGQLLAEEPAKAAEERQAKARKVVLTVDYKNLITQHAKTGEAPAPGMFAGWLLDEINSPSLLRDQIAEDIYYIENNGRNSNFLRSYLSTDGLYLGRLVFAEGDLKVRRVDGEKGSFIYQASFLVTDYFHRGETQIEFVFTFKVKVEPFVYTKAHQITVVSYPKFEKKNEKEVVYPRAKENTLEQ